MKRSLVFILLLLSSLPQAARACWYYPEGDEIRFCFFNAFIGRYPQYSMFNYTSSAFADSPPVDYKSISGEDPNIALWVKYCNNKVSAESAADAVYLMGSDISGHLPNDMTQYLYKIKDYEALDYLKFAKTVEDYNAFYDNPWERDDDILSPKRKGKIELAVAKAKQAKNTAIKSRYYFLAIRMAFYNKDHETAKKLYEEYFAGKKHNDIIDYWSLYFRIAGEKDAALQSYYAALVFDNAPDKRFQVFYYFNREIPVADILKHAKNKAEKAAIYQMYAVRRADYAMEGIQGVYKNDSRSDVLGFLLMREMNKLEDWIYTPYYSYFDPMLFDGYSEGRQGEKLMMERVAGDRQYAAKVLRFVNSVDLKKVKDPEVFRAAKAYLLFMVKDYQGCLSYIASLKKGTMDTGAQRQLLLIQSLCLTANQHYGSAVVPEQVKQVLMEELDKSNSKFIFAVGRELEYLGNTTDAALIYSRISNVTYRAKDLRSPYYNDYYSYYFDYIDGAYTATAVKALIADLNNKRGTGEFSEWLYKEMNDMNSLYDLLGTKHIRLNRLTEALAAYNKMDMESRASDYLDANPFYEFNYTPDFVERRDSIKLTKADITRHLIKYIAKGADPNEKDRDYYNFLVGNCYYNMTQNGNTWYMRRYTWSSSELTSSLPDEYDFHSCTYAKQYYLKAFKYAKTRKFRALCMRMAAKCEHKRLEYYHESDEYALANNPYKEKVKKLYPSYYDDLYESGCVSYRNYFKARR